MSRAWTQQPGRGGKPPADTPPRAPVLCCSHSIYLVFGHSSSRAGGGEPPGSPPLARLPVLGHRDHELVCLVTLPVSCLDTAAVHGGKPPPDPPPRARPQVLGHIFIYLFLKKRHTVMSLVNPNMQHLVTRTTLKTNGTVLLADCWL